MIRMLSIEDFEHISVTELCKEAKGQQKLRFTRITVTAISLDDIFNDSA